MKTAAKEKIYIRSVESILFPGHIQTVVRSNFSTTEQETIHSALYTELNIGPLNLIRFFLIRALILFVVR